MKKVTRLGLLVCLIMVFTMLFSTMAWAASLGTSGTKCPLKNTGNQQITVDQFQKWLGLGSCSNNTDCVDQSCNNVTSCLSKNLCPNPGTCLVQTGTAKDCKKTQLQSTPAPASKPTVTKPVPAKNSTPKATKPAPEKNSTPASTPVAGLTADEQKMVDLVNAERTAAGLPALEVDMRLVKTARMKSQDMIDNNYFDHNSPTYGSPFDLMKSQGITYRTAGENLAGNSSVDGAHKGLMNSSGHRANILNKNYTHIGIGIIDGGPYGKMFTQHFIG
ncbi:CAP domain-containing protein [Candidatus Formimonas warabiya]|uniref:SCP domain-containing protein n=1 Tax=Formimonas warabiya TaxID=1761012 RepID=A0A3G1KUD2_FORW1|nr:CAP domain-containing protein [Candidatus Formimonas warabiya]ATW26027.1 hypothetical protein DCMF_15720 [Candidatus Formimonas warabiya]